MGADVLLLRIRVGIREPLWTGFMEIPQDRGCGVPGSMAGWPQDTVDTL